MPTPALAQLEAILTGQGHEPCPGVDIQFNVSLGAAPGGAELHATIYRPGNRPAVPAPGFLVFHGGGFQHGNPDCSGAIAKMLAVTLGITTVSASYRLATDEKSTFPGLIDDALHGYRWLQAHSAELNINPARVAVGGESAGVFLACHLAVNSPFVAWSADEIRPAAFIFQWGPIDLVARWFDRGESPGAERPMLGTHYDENPALYHRASPLTYAYGALRPALFIYGRQDMVVHARQGRLGHAAWQAAAAHSELHIINNIGHGVEGDNRSEHHQQLRAAVDFMAAMG